MQEPANFVLIQPFRPRLVSFFPFASRFLALVPKRLEKSELVAKGRLSFKSDYRLSRSTANRQGDRETSGQLPGGRSENKCTETMATEKIIARNISQTITTYRYTVRGLDDI